MSAMARPTALEEIAESLEQEKVINEKIQRLIDTNDRSGLLTHLQGVAVRMAEDINHISTNPVHPAVLVEPTTPQRQKLRVIQDVIKRL